jgi:hypothetical protein
MLRELTTSNKSVNGYKAFEPLFPVTLIWIFSLIVLLVSWPRSRTHLTVQWTGGDQNIRIWCVLWKHSISGNQYCGSGFGSVGSVCFWTSRIRIRHYSARIWFGSGSFHQ